ncbi:MAG: TerD family protein [Oscillospiraceae bacterium]|nr:TerD family protein [Oscillospiraceae bacterium]
MNINDLIARANAGETVQLPAGEFEGPVNINKPLRLIGRNTTVWAKNGAVLDINSNGVFIEDLRVEITEGTTNDTAVSANFITSVKNVEILGSVRGFGGEDGFFDVPRTIELGDFLSDGENTFLLEVNVPEKTEVACGMREVTLSPSTLNAGRNTITLGVSGCSAGTLLYGEILFKSMFTRRIYLTGRPIPTADPARNRQIYTAPHRDDPTAPAASALPAADVISMTRTSGAGSGDLAMKRGQRVAVSDYVGTVFSIYFSCEKQRSVDVDPYVFLLDKDGRALGDSSLIFFGNELSDNGEVRYCPNDGHIEVDLVKTDFRIERIVLAYAVYAADNINNFSVVKNPRISLRTDKERISFNMDGLSSEAAVVAVELYLYKGEWKISAVGAGYNNGMARLCNSYGIDVVE